MARARPRCRGAADSSEPVRRGGARSVSEFSIAPIDPQRRHCRLSANEGAENCAGTAERRHGRRKGRSCTNRSTSPMAAVGLFREPRYSTLDPIFVDDGSNSARTLDLELWCAVNHRRVTGRVSFICSPRPSTNENKNDRPTVYRTVPLVVGRLVLSRRLLALVSPEQASQPRRPDRDE